ncbi:MAG: hypothetical protein H0T77_15085 [Pyrinomonadaceae bacterium]|nr:hypothetical protein [Pyrinomonadaceae bacterium]
MIRRKRTAITIEEDTSVKVIWHRPVTRQRLWSGVWRFVAALRRLASSMRKDGANS